MLATPNNLYRASTATTVANSGLGSNTMTKPAGTEVASIQPGGKYSVYIPSAATFTTNFNADVDSYTIFFYAKPNPGALISVAGNTVTYDRNTFRVTNETGGSLSIPFSSHRAHLIVMTLSDMEVGLYVDGQGGNVSARVTSDVGQLPVSLLLAGGILGDVYAMSGLINNEDMQMLTETYLSFVPTPFNTEMLFDSTRDLAYPYTLPDESAVAGEHRVIMLEDIDCMAFKVEYLLDGDAEVYVNGYPGHSGIVVEENPSEITLVATGDATLRDIRLRVYTGPFVTAGTASVSTTQATGTDAPTHLHDDNAGTTGSTTVVLDEQVSTVSGWFKAQDGSVLPGVSMTNGILTGTGLYVNGKAYSGGTVTDWYLLTKTGVTTEPFTSTVPVHAIHATPAILTTNEIDDLYESFFGNPVLTVDAETIGLTEEAAMVISSEWSIIASG